MFQYSYTATQFTATLTSSSSINSFDSFYTISANTSTTYEELLLTTGTYQYTYTDTTVFTYTNVDAYGQSTGTCDYSVGSSLQIESGATTSDPYAQTSTYATTEHSSNGTHSITTRSAVGVQFLDNYYSTTQHCNFTYYNVAVISGSTDFGTLTRYTYRTITHDIFATHTVSYRTLELVLFSDTSGTTTGHCDYLAASTQTTVLVSDFSYYTAIYYYTTTHDIYNIGIHTIDGRTSEVATSLATVTLSSNRVSETTATTVVNVAGLLRTSSFYQTNQTGYFSVSSLSVVYDASQNSYTAVLDAAYTDVTNVTISNEYPAYGWSSYVLTGSDGNTSVGYEKWITAATYTQESTSYFSYSSSNWTYKTTAISQYNNSTAYTSSREIFYYTNGGSATYAIVSLGNLAYTTSAGGTSGVGTNQTFGSTTGGSFTYTTTKTTFDYPVYLSITTSTTGPAAANRTTYLTTHSSTRVVSAPSISGSATTTTAPFSTTTLSTRFTTSTQKSYTAVSYAISSTQDRYLWIRYLALSGEVLYIPTITDAGTFRLSDAGYTATAWNNEPVINAYITPPYSFSDFTSTVQSQATLASFEFNKQYLTGTPSLSMDPDNVAAYSVIPTPLSAVDTPMFNQNNDYALFGLQAYNRVDTSSQQGITFGAGAFDYTLNEVAGAIAFSAINQINAQTGAQRIHPRATIAIDTESNLGASYLFNYSTSNIVTRV